MLSAPRCWLALMVVLGHLAHAQDPQPNCPPPSVWSGILKQCVGAQGTRAPVEEARPVAENNVAYYREIDEPTSGVGTISASVITAGGFGVSVGRDTRLWHAPGDSRLGLGLLTLIGVFLVPDLFLGIFVPIQAAASLSYAVVPEVFQVSLDAGLACGVSSVPSLSSGQRLVSARLYFDTGFSLRVKSRSASVWFQVSLQLLISPTSKTLPTLAVGVGF